MHPELFKIGDFVVSTYGLMLVVAFLAAYFQLRWGFRKLAIGDEEDAASLVFWAGLSGIIGSKIYYALLVGSWRALFDRAGLVWYGGFLCAVVALLWVVRRRRLPIWATVDVMTLALAIGYALGRVGCLLVGDDYGAPTDLPWAIAFPEGSPPSTAENLRSLGMPVDPGVAGSAVLAVHPTQIYETLGALAIWFLGHAYLRRRPSAGQTGLLVLALLGLERLLVEFVRAKDDRFFGAFTLAQLISLGLIAVALFLFLRRRRSASPSAP